MKAALLTTILLCTACGTAKPSVCGVEYEQKQNSVFVSGEDVSPLPGASFAAVGDKWALEQGGFASSENVACQFGVRDGVVYQ